MYIHKQGEYIYSSHLYYAVNDYKYQYIYIYLYI